ncbi:MAG: hypothetical protein ACI4UH_05345 [Dorea sp.]
MRIWKEANKNQRMMILVTGGMFLLGIVILLWDYRNSSSEIEEGLKRNDYGEGEYVEELKVKDADGNTVEIEVEVGERQYTESEVEMLFERCIAKLEDKILGENESYDCIDSDMNLVTELSGEEVDIAWELDQYNVMNVYGELKDSKLQEEGTMVNLRGTLTYREDEKAQAVYECSVMVYPEKKGKAEAFAEKVMNSIQEENIDTKTKDMFILPEKVGERNVEYFYKMDSKGIVLIVMALLMGILSYALGIQNRENHLKERKQQMLVDYPEIINKLTLYLGAGMIVKRAWKKMIEDYESQREFWGARYVYEEMKQTYYEMESGVSEVESYERFGRRCNIQEYMKLGALLSQNLRKGTKGLGQMLKMEAIQAFEERKARAKRLGEEAGTKLLVPMFMMLAVVLVIVIVPAFLSIQL